MERAHGPVSPVYYTDGRPITVGYKLLDELSIQGALVIDVGAFAGFIGNYCLQRGARVTLIDIFKGAFPSFMFSVQGSKEQMPFRDNFFDFAVCGDTLHHGDLDSTLLEIYRILRPGGQFISVREPCIASSEDEWTVLQKDCGLVVAEGICERRPNLIQYKRALTVFPKFSVYSGVDLTPAKDLNYGDKGIVIKAIK